MTNTPAAYSAARIVNRIKALGRELSRACKGRRLDVVVTMDRGFMFAADLIRHIDAPVALHFVREDVRDVEEHGAARREVFFASGHGAPRLPRFPPSRAATFCWLTPSWKAA